MYFNFLSKYQLTFIFVLFFSSTSFATSEEGAINIGSTMAAGALCEQKGWIEKYRVMKYMNFFQSNVSEKVWEKFNYGYQNGIKKIAVYSKNHKKWVKFNLTKKFCQSDIDYAIGSYMQRAFPN